MEVLMTEVFDFTTALAEAARAINRPQTVEETLQAIAHTARHNIPGFDQIGVSPWLPPATWSGSWTVSSTS
jgi:hypothetical protein